jgi:hypothetical protein
MVLAFNDRNAFVSSLDVIILLSFAALLIASILLVPIPSFADRIIAVRQGTTLALGCDLSNDDDLITTTKVFNYDQPSRLIFNCERSGVDVDLKKGESIAIRCLHDNPLTIPKHVKMKAGELFYILCNIKRNSG